MKKNTIIITLLLTLMSLITACFDDSEVPTVTTTSTSPESRARKTAPAEETELTESNWIAAKNWQRATITRNPFKGFTDTLIEQKILQQEMQKLALEDPELAGTPAQKYDIRDFKLVGVITGTADPKAFLIDPAGVRHTLRRGDLIGNRNGTLVKIGRNTIEVFEMISNEGKYTEIKLFPEQENKNINIRLQ